MELQGCNGYVLSWANLDLHKVKRSSWGEFNARTSFVMGNSRRVKFWHGMQCGMLYGLPFPLLSLASKMEIDGGMHWNPVFYSIFMIGSYKMWVLSSNRFKQWRNLWITRIGWCRGVPRIGSSWFNLSITLQGQILEDLFHAKEVKNLGPHKVAFFAWEAAQENGESDDNRHNAYENEGMLIQDVYDEKDKDEQ